MRRYDNSIATLDSVANGYDSVSTGGGVACVIEAGKRYESKRRGIDKYERCSLMLSGSAFNGASEAAGTLDEDFPDQCASFSRKFINKYAAAQSLLDKMPESSWMRRAVYGILNHPTALKTIADLYPDSGQREVLERLIDMIPSARRLLEENKGKPIADMSCVDFLVNKIFDGGGEAKIRAFHHPVFVLVYNHTTKSAEYMDLRVEGRAALRATSAITGTVNINGIEYSDPAFQIPFDFDQLPPGYNRVPRIISDCHGQRGLLGNLETKAFFESQFDKETYVRYRANQRSEEQQLRQLAKEDDVLILRSNLDIGFSTKDPVIIKKAWQEGIGMVDRIEQFLEKLYKTNRLQSVSAGRLAIAA